MISRARLRTLVARAGLPVIAAAVVAGGLLTPPHQSLALPLRHIGEVALPGDSSRFDYASLDPGRGLLFIAHLGASEVIEVDIHTRRVVRTITGLPDLHGVLAVPEPLPRVDLAGAETSSVSVTCRYPRTADVVFRRPLRRP
jgi:hypothetical protein